MNEEEKFEEEWMLGREELKNLKFKTEDNTESVFELKHILENETNMADTFQYTKDEVYKKLEKLTHLTEDKFISI